MCFRLPSITALSPVASRYRVSKELVVEFKLGNETGRKAVREGGGLEIKGSADKPLTIIKATYQG